MSKPITVTVIPDGPLKLSGEDLSLTFGGEPLPRPDGDVYLCRCGDSASAPFCDKSHARNGFRAEPPAGGAKPLKVWQGRTLETHFNPNACMHVFHCKPLNDLRAAELAGDDAAAAEIASVVVSCPSGALSFESTSVARPDQAPGPDVEIVEGGEIRLRGTFEINQPLLERQTGDRATLCRCGRSKNKPWCDGRHRKRVGFR